MKSVIVERVNEEVKYYCDNNHHAERECHSSLKTLSWYGSKFDNTGLELHLCDECLEEMYKLLYREFGYKPKEIEI